MKEKNGLQFWSHKCDNENDAVRLGIHVREFGEQRDTCDCTFPDKVECKTIIDFSVLIKF